jgi:hypothetical protein
VLSRSRLLRRNREMRAERDIREVEQRNSRLVILKKPFSLMCLAVARSELQDTFSL